MLVPSSDTGVEIELPEMLRRVNVPASLHIARMRLPSVAVADLLALAAEAEHQAERLADARPDLVLFACTSGTFVLGQARETQLVKRLTTILAAPVVTAAQAVVAAVARQGERVRLRGSYTEDLLELERAYLEAHGLRVTSVAGLGISVDETTARLPASQLQFLIGGTDDPDVILLSCTNLRVLRLLDTRSASSVPVVTSNTALADSVADWVQGVGVSGPA